MTIYEVSLSAGVTLTILTICGILGKFLWEIINLKVANKYKDYMSREQLSALVHSVMKTGNVITSPELIAFCERAQGSCPRSADYNSLEASLKTFTDTIKEVVNEQKILRQHTLPKEYTSLHAFETTIGRIERTMSESTGRVEASVARIEARLDK